MTAVQQVKAALVTALQNAGLEAMGAYSEEELKKYQTAVVAVGVREMQTTHAGALEYLGERYDAVHDVVLEVYGRKLLLKISLDVYAPRTLGAEGCEEAAETVTQTMMSALPGGLQMKRVDRAETKWDRVYGMFHLSAAAEYEAFFSAETSEENVVFTDFILRGVVQEHE